MENKNIYKGNENLSYFCYFVACNLFVLGLMIGGQSKTLGFAGVGMWRGIGMVIIGITMQKINNLSFDFKDPIQFRKLTIRNILCGIQSFALSLSFFYISPPIVHTIVNSGPLCIFVADYFMNGSKITKKQALGLLLACIGIIMTVNIDIFSKILGIQISNSSVFQYEKVSTLGKLLIVFFLISSTCLWSIGMVQTKNLKSDSFAITFHIGVLLVVVNGLMMVLGGTKTDKWSISEVIFDFVGVGVVLGLSNLFQTLSVRLQNKTGNATMVGFWAVILGYLISVFRYKEEVNLIGVVGSIVIFIGLVVALYK